MKEIVRFQVSSWYAVKPLAKFIIPFESRNLVCARVTARVTARALLAMNFMTIFFYKIISNFEIYFPMEKKFPATWIQFILLSKESTKNQFIWFERSPIQPIFMYQ